MLCLKPCSKILINTVSKMISADLMNAGSRKCYLKPTRKYKIKLVRSESTPPVVKKQNGPKMPKIVWSIIWLIILIIFSFWIATFLAFFYIILFPITVCIPDISVVTDFLLKCIQFPKYCAENMMAGTALF
ncbi:unnamed protein product [Chironomus riparius]|uniref:Uncharacterized protein n=1 Tax=Chironomus riparius TaxID=315576 RepID=A0A9N9S0I4_9DIPT|nr:unnamed protein product [Chironomus riparius]